MRPQYRRGTGKRVANVAASRHEPTPGRRCAAHATKTAPLQGWRPSGAWRHAMTSPITGELSNSKVAAVFPRESAARKAAEGVSAAVSLEMAQVQVITPAEPHPGRKLEPESR